MSKKLAIGMLFSIIVITLIMYIALTYSPRECISNQYLNFEGKTRYVYTLCYAIEGE